MTIQDRIQVKTSERDKIDADYTQLAQQYQATAAAMNELVKKRAAVEGAILELKDMENEALPALNGIAPFNPLEHEQTH